ncbi:hypothetical protein DRP05_07735 [Archaeoglobales archaeon]|nr:MAG: hypothetical protein DRP05_07735 [Archaeoglobales archaeon]
MEKSIEELERTKKMLEMREEFKKIEKVLAAILDLEGELESTEVVEELDPNAPPSLVIRLSWAVPVFLIRFWAEAQTIYFDEHSFSDPTEIFEADIEEIRKMSDLELIEKLLAWQKKELKRLKTQIDFPYYF